MYIQVGAWLVKCKSDYGTCLKVVLYSVTAVSIEHASIWTNSSSLFVEIIFSDYDSIPYAEHGSDAIEDNVAFYYPRQ